MCSGHGRAGEVEGVSRQGLGQLIMTRYLSSCHWSLLTAHRTGRVYCELHLEPDSRGPSLYSPYILIHPPQFRAGPVLYNKHCKLLHCMAGLTATRYLGIHFKTVELVIARTLHCCKNNSFFYKPLVPQPAPSCKSLVSSAPPR